MKVLQINTAVNSGSTGRIAEGIGKELIDRGHQSLIAFGRGNQPSSSKTIRISSRLDLYSHVLISRIFDLHGFGSTRVTRKFLEELEKADPDIIHLHNIHGYYLNIEILFNYLLESGKPVVWTLHDCWPFTGHCSYFNRVNCYKWQSECYNCPNLKGYPKSWFIDNSRSNFIKKRELFKEVRDLTLVSPSYWLANHLKNSFFKNSEITVIQNGTDTDFFKPVDYQYIRSRFNLKTEKLVIGVASIWDNRKGLADFVKLRQALPSGISIILVGLSKQQISGLPEGVKGIYRTESKQDLAALYSAADVFVNLTYADNFPSTNIEALACGLPVVTYDTGGSPEAVDENTGYVVPRGDINGAGRAIERIIEKGKEHYCSLCRDRALSLFSNRVCFSRYIDLFENIISRSK